MCSVAKKPVETPVKTGLVVDHFYPNQACSFGVSWEEARPFPGSEEQPREQMTP